MSATFRCATGTKPLSGLRYDSAMAISNWSLLDGELPVEDYKRRHAEAVGLTLEQFDRWLIVTECDCGEEGCEGWAAVPRLKVQREQRERRRRELEFERSRAERVGEYVYFARLGDLIKIGFSTNPKRRAEEVNGRLLGYCEGTRELERRLHYEFRHLRERGEWFRADPDILSRIEALCE